MDWSLRLANESDIPELEALIERSVRELQAADYSTAQMDGALGSVFGVDRQLIRDQTYFVAEQNGAIIACGGWSKRESLFGTRCRACRRRTPCSIRSRMPPAFAPSLFIRSTLVAASDAPFSSRAKTRFAPRVFARSTLVATLPGVPFYRAFDYETGERYDVPLANGLSLPVVRMSKNLMSPKQ